MGYQDTARGASQLARAKVTEMSPAALFASEGNLPLHRDIPYCPDVGLSGVAARSSVRVLSSSRRISATRCRKTCTPRSLRSFLGPREYTAHPWPSGGEYSRRSTGLISRRFTRTRIAESRYECLVRFPGGSVQRSIHTMPGLWTCLSKTCFRRALPLLRSETPDQAASGLSSS